MNYIFLRFGSKVIYIGPYELFSSQYKSYVDSYEDSVNSLVSKEEENYEI